MDDEKIKDIVKNTVENIIQNIIENSVKNNVENNVENKVENKVEINETSEISKLQIEGQNKRLECEKKRDELFELQRKEKRIQQEIQKLREQKKKRDLKKSQKKNIVNKKHSIQYVLYIEFSDTIKNNPELLEKYNTRIKKHNENMIYNKHFDSGFDLFIPSKNIKIKKDEVKLVSLDIKCACYKFDIINTNKIPIYRIINERVKKGRGTSALPYPFKIFPRSSMWKKGVLLANCTGIIDSGYRGFLFAPFYSIKNENLIEYSNRYVQICMPSLDRFLIKVVNKLDTNTKRGEGGCGSTGQ